jgi:hypothetical protein
MEDSVKNFLIGAFFAFVCWILYKFFTSPATVENYMPLESQDMAAAATPVVDTAQKQPGYLKTYLSRPQIQGTNIIDSLGRNPNWMLNYTPPVRIKGAGFPIYKTDYDAPGGLVNVLTPPKSSTVLG